MNPANLNWMGVIAALVVIYLSLVIRWVPKPYQWVIEINNPFGGDTKYFTWKPGFHFLWFPVAPIMFVRNKINTAHKVIQLNMGMTTGFGNPNRIDFKDGVDAGLEVQVTYEVSDPIKATYNVEHHEVVIEKPDQSGIRVFQSYEVATLNRLEAQLRSFFGDMTFAQANADSERKRLEKSILEGEEKDGVLTDGISKFIKENWGIHVIDVDLMDFDLNEEIVKNRQRILTADITAQAAKREAEGKRDATITVAEGDKRAAELAGEGELARLRAIQNTGLDPAHAAAYTLARENVAALGKTQTTVIATSEGGSMSQLAGMLGMAKGVFGSGGAPATPAPKPPASTPAPTPAPTPSPSPAPGTPPATPPASSPTPLGTRRRGTY